MIKIFKKPYVYYFILVFIFYLILNVILSGFYNTIKLIFIYANTVDWVKLCISILLTLAIGFLVAYNSVYIYLVYRERKQCKEAGAVAGVGTLGGLAVGVCPLCVTGVVPLILGTLGISFSFASLPFSGIEFQILVIGILFFSLWLVKNQNI